MKALTSLRNEVRKVDSDIMSLVAKRMEITRMIGEIKKREGIPLANWQVEKEVLEQAGSTAQKMGIEKGFAISIMKQLIDGSRMQQELQHYSAYRGDKERILIIGGLGDMGGWFCRFFQNQGHEVSIYDIRGGSDEFTSYVRLSDGLEDASIVFITTSLEAVPSIINELVRLEFRGMIVDIASLKGHLKKSIGKAREKGSHIASIHPMFGPQSRTLAGKILCLCDCKDRQANELVMRLFGETALTIVRISLKEHDRVVSYVLGLSHIINIVLMKVLRESGFSYGELRRVASTTFLSQMETATSVIKENPDLYYEIQHCNPFREELYRDISDALKEVTEKIRRGARDEFARAMEEGERWLQE